MHSLRIGCFEATCHQGAETEVFLGSCSLLQRRVADLWRHAADGVGNTVNWADLYQTRLDELAGLSAEGAVPEAELRARLDALVTANRQRRPPSRASLVRERLIEAIRPVRSLLVAITRLPWQAHRGASRHGRASPVVRPVRPRCQEAA
jgi:hypothetical protein